jgi:hypothetical protein
MANPFSACSGAFGKRVTRLSSTMMTAGIAALIVGCLLDRTDLALGTLAAAWLFFAGMAAGGVAFSATVRASHGGWAAAALPYAEAAGGFFPVALVLLAVLVAGATAWMPGAPTVGSVAWIFRVVRDLGASAVLFAVGAHYLKLRGRESDAPPVPRRVAVVYLLLYAATLSLWAIDLVMSLHEWAPSTVIPAFYFMGAFLAAIAWAAILVALREPGEDSSNTRHDLGKLLFAFIIFWGYLLWAAYLPVWYGNLPEETGQLMARWTGDWKFVSLAVIATVLAFPFLFLLPERTKRGRTTLLIAAASILAGLLGERFLLVLPSLTLPADGASVLLGALVTLGVAGAFVVSVGARLGRNLDGRQPWPGGAAPQRAPLLPGRRR